MSQQRKLLHQLRLISGNIFAVWLLLVGTVVCERRDCVLSVALMESFIVDRGFS